MDPEKPETNESLSRLQSELLRQLIRRKKRLHPDDSLIRCIFLWSALVRQSVPPPDEPSCPLDPGPLGMALRLCTDFFNMVVGMDVLELRQNL